ncbi:hypothetical protein D3C79_753890 [compost metagenome]
MPPLLDQHQVQLPTVIGAHQIPAQATGNLQLHRRVTPVERRQRLHRLARDKIVRQADAHGHRHPARHGLGQLAAHRQQVPRIPQQGFPGIGRVHLAVAAVEQLLADHFLQPAHLLADRGLGGVQARGSGGETAAVGHHDHGAEHVQVIDGTVGFDGVRHLRVQLLWMGLGT